MPVLELVSDALLEVVERGVEPEVVDEDGEQHAVLHDVRHQAGAHKALRTDGDSYLHNLRRRINSFES